MFESCRAHLASLAGLDASRPASRRDQYFDVVVVPEDDEDEPDVSRAPIIPWPSWNLHTNLSWPLAGNLTSVSVSSPGWISLSTL
jgi:hypothetical protein